MKGLVAVWHLEVARRWTLLPLACALGLAPFGLAPLLQASFGPLAGRETVVMLGLLISLLLAGIACILLGATLFGSDLASGRAGFLYACPLDWAAIWAGRHLAAFTLVVGCGLVAWLPASLTATEGLGPRALFDFQGAFYLVGLTLFVLGATNLASLALHARSAWLLVDLAAIPCAVWLLANVVGPRLARMPEAFLAPFLLHLLVWPPALALLAASAVQVAHGRTDLVRSHRLASSTFWSLFALMPLAWWLAVD